VQGHCREERRGREGRGGEGKRREGCPRGAGVTKPDRLPNDRRLLTAMVGPELDRYPLLSLNVRFPLPLYFQT